MNRLLRTVCCIILFCLIAAWPLETRAQVPPSSEDVSKYTAIFAAAARGDAKRIEALVTKGERVEVRDAYGRTPLHVAAYGGHHEAMRALVRAGADPNALEYDRYDIVTIAAVANDIPTLEVSLALGGSAKNISSRYDGTALIAAAHLTRNRHDREYPDGGLRRNLVTRPVATIRNRSGHCRGRSPDDLH